MYKLLKRVSVALALFLGTGAGSFAQDHNAKDKEAEYTKVITQRAEKIVVNLGISDQAKSAKVRDIIAQQYRDLNTFHDARKAKIKVLKEQGGEDKQAVEAKIKNLEAAEEKKLSKLHKRYISRLSKELSADHVEKVKDGMTYNVLPGTYQAYLEMLPTLNEQQKARILSDLTEAREHAMDAESSEKKHWWFGKYKGRINNYLTAEGVDTKTAREVWEKKLKERQKGQ